MEQCNGVIVIVKLEPNSHFETEEQRINSAAVVTCHLCVEGQGNQALQRAGEQHSWLC